MAALSTQSAVGANGNSKVIPSKVLSYDPPTEKEKALNVPLELWKETQIEPIEESNRRSRCLKKLDGIMKWWIRHVMINDLRMSEKDAARYEGRIFTTGSYRYNVHTSGSDIDAVLIAPKLVTRAHFFDSFAAKLNAEPLVTELTPVTNAIVPIIAIKFEGIEMDLSFGSIQHERVPEKITDDLLRGLDDASVRSANAPRVAHQLLEYAPVAYEFRTALRFIKLWAKVRGIHGSQYGFPTGIGWAILVCFVCQCYPNKNAAGVLVSFFRVLGQWYKPDHTNTSIYLSEQRITSNEFGPSWDPTNRRDAQALFPVLTPVAPSTNACAMVTRHTLRILCAELKRGQAITAAACASTNNTNNSTNAINNSINGAQETPSSTSSPPFGVWSTLLEPYPFFESHQRYLHIEVASTSSFDYVRRYKPYVDFIESRLSRLLAGGKGIDQIPYLALRPWPKRYEPAEQTAYIEEALRVQRASASASAAGNGGNGGSAGGVGASGGGGLLSPQLQQQQSQSQSVRPPPGNLLTAHIFIGIDIDPNAKRPATAAPLAPPSIESNPLLAQELHNFVEFIVADTAVFHHGITRRPTIRVIPVSEVPLWIFDPSKSAVLKQRAAAEEEAKRKQQMAAAAEEGGGGGGGASQGSKRQREESGLSTTAADANSVRTTGFAGLASVVSVAAVPSTVGAASASASASAAGGSSNANAASTMLSMAPAIAIAQSVVNSTPVIAAPTLLNASNGGADDDEDELGMDF